MQELEKILKEIKELHGKVGGECAIEDRHAKRAWEHCLKRVEDIIHKYMNDAEYPYITKKNIEDDPPVSEKFLRDCKKVAEKYKRDNGGWIPVEKELPPNAKQKGAFCPKYQVMTKYGVTEGWYNPDYESWFCLFWFVDNKFTKPYIDFEHGDMPKRIQIEKGVDLVLAWGPMPEPYKPERRAGE